MPLHQGIILGIQGIQGLCHWERKIALVRLIKTLRLNEGMRAQTQETCQQG
jgi:hypothetical protein